MMIMLLVIFATLGKMNFTGKTAFLKRTGVNVMCVNIFRTHIHFIVARIKIRAYRDTLSE